MLHAKLAVITLSVPAIVLRASHLEWPLLLLPQPLSHVTRA
ncbi:hypothetical protein ID866_9096 [Astraeus odoratus]|nr:hypothetical protein ID866_9096 [Astraeus odoratus]